jgi:catechol 2,3-dioxygenase-like lactoylglutathione lyase family enzyme
MTTPRFDLRSTVLGTPDPRGLASFYRALLDWDVIDEEDEWVKLKPAGNPDGTGLSFQLEEGHTAPAWPAREGDQQMQLHLDIRVQDLVAATGFAQSLGARVAEFQPQNDVRVMLDPAGHPFCLFAE